jgi:phosphate uptake regulator
MEIRRVQMTGGSSYIITLPKEWVKAVRIEKNDPLGLIQQPDGTLLITHTTDREQIKTQKEFNIETGINQQYLFRELIGAYIAGFNSIKITSKQRMQPATRTTIRRFIQNTIGQEVVEETDTTITLKDLLNPSEMPFTRTIKRMHIITKSMYEDSIRALKEKDSQLTQDVITRDNEVDRLHWLIARQHRIIQENVSFAEKMGTTLTIATTAYLISRIIERIADHVCRIATNISHILDETINSNIIEKVDETSHLSLSLFSKSIGAFTKKEIKEANEIFTDAELLIKKCKELDSLALNQDASLAMSLGTLVESMGRIGDYSKDIAESVINHLIGEGK